MDPPRNPRPSRSTFIPGGNPPGMNIASPSYFKRSTNIAMPMPPATHIDSMP